MTNPEHIPQSALYNDLIRDDVRDQVIANLGDCIACRSLDLDTHLQTPIDAYLEDEQETLSRMVNSAEVMQGRSIRREIVGKQYELNEAVTTIIANVLPYVQACRAAREAVPANMPDQCWSQHGLEALSSQLV